MSTCLRHEVGTHNSEFPPKRLNHGKELPVYEFPVAQLPAKRTTIFILAKVMDFTAHFMPSFNANFNRPVVDP